MNNKLILLLFAIVFMTTLVPAQLTANFVFEQNTVIDLKISCFDEDNNFCNSSVECNITILRPNQEVIVNNLPMTFNTAFYNLTLDTNETSVLGRHSSIGICTGNSTGFSTFTFDITPTGFVLETGQSLVVLGSLILLLFLSGSLLFFSNKVETTSVKIFLISMGVLLSVFAVGFSISIIKELLLFGDVFSGTLVGLFRLGVALIIAGLVGIILFLTTSVLKAFSKSRGKVDEDD